MSLQQLLNQLKEDEMNLFSKYRRDASASWGKWIKEHSKGGAGPIHKWVKGPEAAALPLLVHDVRGNPTAKLQARVEAEVVKWLKIWDQGDRSLQLKVPPHDTPNMDPLELGQV